MESAQTINPHVQKILDLAGIKKHLKIHLLLEAGVKKTEVAKMCKTNIGHVYNVEKMYRQSPEATNIANQFKTQNSI